MTLGMDLASLDLFGCGDAYLSSQLLRRQRDEDGLNLKVQGQPGNLGRPLSQIRTTKTSGHGRNVFYMHSRLSSQLYGRNCSITWFLSQPSSGLHDHHPLDFWVTSKVGELRKQSMQSPATTSFQAYLHRIQALQTLCVW